MAEAGRAVIVFTNHEGNTARFDQIEQYVLSAKSGDTGKSLLPGGRKSLEKLLAKMVETEILSTQENIQQISENTQFTLAEIGIIFADCFRNVPKLITWTEDPTK